jgi:DNA-binding NarL/FixJ family response regulator
VSARERDVLAAFAAGPTNPAIARALGLSTNTVKQHASSIFRKLGVRNRAEAVRRADELGLLQLS